MDAVMRYQVADYLNTAKSGTESFALMGVGFNTLDEYPNAQKDSKTYINQKSQTSTIKSYQPAFAFDSDLIADEAAVMALYEIGRNQLTGADAERDYVRVELFKPVAETPNTFEARKFKVAVEVSSISGEGGGVMKVTGNLNGVGDFVDGTFNTNFLKLSASERTRNLNMAKTVLIAKTNEQLKEYRITKEMGKPGSVWQLLDGVKESEMKNDGYMDLFYEVLGEKYHPGYPFSCFMYYGQYDVPVKGTDKEWMEGSEEVYSYLLCVISPLTGEYEPGAPEFGFLYPAFKDRSTGWEVVNVYEKLPERVHREWMEWLFK